MLLDLLGRGHHQVGHLVDDDDDIGQDLLTQFSQMVVKTLQVAHPGLVQELVAPLHLLDAPEKHPRSAVHVGYDRAQEMGRAVVDGQLDHLGVDHEQPQRFRRVRQQQTADDRIDADRLARSGGARDQQMGHAREVGSDRLAAHVLAQRDRQAAARLHRLERLALHQLLEADIVALRIGHLDADIACPRDRRLDAHGARRQRQRKVVRKTGDLADLDLGAFDLAAHHPLNVAGTDQILRDRGAGVDAFKVGRDAEQRQRLLQQPPAVADQIVAVARPVPEIQHIVQLRELPHRLRPAVPGRHLLFAAEHR